MNTTSEKGRTQAQVNAGIPDRIEKKVILRAPRARVWRALTNIEEFKKWFGLSQADGDFAPGARLRMMPTEAKYGEFYVFVEQMERERLFSWRWHPGALDPQANYAAEPTTLVVFELEDVPGGTQLTITESGFRHVSLARRAAVFGENTEGWDAQAESLEKYVSQAS